MQTKKVLGLITARGGSKGLPRKNVLPVGGRPLIAWTITAALQARCIDRLVLSTDDDEIMAVAQEWGCEVPFRRPNELASDTATSKDVVLHALQQLPGYDYVVLLQPTSPARTAADIDQAFDVLTRHQASSCVSVCEVEQSPYWMYTLDQQDKLKPVLPQDQPVTRRQDLPAVWVLNGAIYLVEVQQFLETQQIIHNKTVAYTMPKSRSIDIDTAEDLEQFGKQLQSEYSVKV